MIFNPGRHGQRYTQERNERGTEAMSKLDPSQGARRGKDMPVAQGSIRATLAGSGYPDDGAQRDQRNRRKERYGRKPSES